MKNTFKRSGAALISLVLLLVLAVSAGAASSQNVGVKFWKERSDKESMANSGIDPDRADLDDFLGKWRGRWPESSTCSTRT